MSSRKILTEAQISDLVKKNPDLPSEYLEYLRTVGWGEAPSGYMIYSGPMLPEDIYGDAYDGPPVVLLGDDTQGYCLGYDLSARQYGEISEFGEWESWTEDETFPDYVNCDDE